MKNRIISVLDAMPGAGKTEFFVEQAARMLNSGKKDKVLVYAAPTTYLLEEVVNRILSKVTVNHYKVEFEDRQNLQFDTGAVIYRAYGESNSVDVTTLVSSLFGVPTKADCAPPAQLGSIILLTHEGLLRLPKTSPHYPPSTELVEDAAERYAKILKEYNARVQKHRAMAAHWNSILPDCILFFDEARSCILKNCMLELDRSQIGQLVSSSTISWTNALPKYNTALPTLLEIKNRAYTGKGIQDWEIPQLVEMALDNTSETTKDIPHFVPPVSDLHNSDEFYTAKMRYYQDANEENMSTYYLSPVGCQGAKEYARVHGYVRHTSLPPSIKNFFTLWKNMGENGRANFILAGKFDVAFIDRDNEDLNRERTYVYYLLINPHSLFESFGKTIIMSAFFKDSQMYHMLKRDSYTFQYVLEKEELPGSLANIKERDVKLRQKLSEKLHFAFLIKSNPKSPYKHNVLSASILNLKILFPTSITKKLEATVKLYAEKNPNKKLFDYKVLRDVVRGGVVYGNLMSPAALKATEPHTVPPLLKLVRTAFDIAKDWSKVHNVTTLNNLRNGTEGPKRLMLCMTNSMDSFDPQVKKSVSDHSSIKSSPFDQVQPLIMLHDFRTHLRDRYASSQEQGERETKYADYLNWCKTVRKKYIELPVQTRLHGLNEYTPYSVFAHLASLNLPPPLARMLHSILPKYDGHQDNVIENLVQTMYRTQLRSLKPEHSDDVLLIVAFRATAVLLCQKLGYSGDALEAFVNSRTFAQSDLSVPYFDLGKEIRTKTAQTMGRNNLKYKVKGQSDLLYYIRSHRSVYRKNYSNTQDRAELFSSTLQPIYEEATRSTVNAKTAEEVAAIRSNFLSSIKERIESNNINKLPKTPIVRIVASLKYSTKNRICKNAEGVRFFETTLLPIFDKASAALKKAPDEARRQQVMVKLKQLLKEARSA